MLPKQNRADKNTIEEIFKKDSFFISSANISFKYKVKIEFKSVRVSFIVPKTVSKKAVVRNLLRRRGYVVLNKYFDQFPAGLVGAFVFGKNSVKLFSGRKSKTKNPIQELEKEIKIIFNKLNRTSFLKK